MPYQIIRVSEDEFVECITQIEGNRVYKAEYIVSYNNNNHAELEELDPHIHVHLSYPPSNDAVIQCRYPLGLGQRWQRKTVSVDRFVDSMIPISDLLVTDYVEMHLNDRRGLNYRFYIEVREHVDLQNLRDTDVIHIEEEEVNYEQILRITNSCPAQSMCREYVPIFNYQHTVGNLEEEVIQNIQVFAGTESQNVSIEIDSIRRFFTNSEFAQEINSALSLQGLPFHERVPQHILQRYPTAAAPPLDVRVTFQELLPHLNYQVIVNTCDIGNVLPYRTGTPSIDQLLLRIIRELIEMGMPIDDRLRTYQRVLANLLGYRHSCNTVPGYITPADADNEVNGFHRHIQSRLSDQLRIDPLESVDSEVDVGNGRIDLLIDGIPTELKLERDTRNISTEEIIDKYKRQTADYAARKERPFGILVILDTVTERGLPASPVTQDTLLVEVRNVSGNTVPIVGIVVRVAQRPSSL